MHTNQLRSLGSLRSAIESRRHGVPKVRSWTGSGDRDLDRIASDLMVISQSECTAAAARSPRH